jgi:tetratricopeptide (TPR) repeat protein
MSMRKAAQRRYPTAQALADDLVRHLDGQTVTARAPTFSYRAGKFIRRHKTGIAAAALIALALLVGIAGTTTGWRRAEIARGNEEIARIAAEKAEDAERAARNAAETRYTQLRRMFTIEDTLYEEIENLPAATAAREVLSDAMLRAIESLAVSFPDDPRLRRDLAEQYLRVGVLASKGQNSAARGVEALERALALLEDAPPADATRLRALVELAEAHRQAGDRDAALAAATNAIDRCAALENDPAAPETLKTLYADALIRSALVHMFRARFDDAGRELNAAAGLAGEAVATRPGDAGALRSLAHAHEQLGVLADQRNDEETELAELRTALDLRREVAQLRPGNAEAAHRLVMAVERTGRALMDLDRHGEAEPYFAEMRELAERARTDDPFSGRALADFARAFENAADLAARTGAPEQAAVFAEAFRDTARAWLDADPLNMHARRMVGLAHYKLARAHYSHAGTLRRTDADAARALYRRAVPEFGSALDVLTDASDRDPNDAALIEDLFRASYWLGYTHWRLGDDDAERVAFLRALAEAERRAGLDSLPTRFHGAVASTASKLADLEFDADDPDAMISGIERAVALTGIKTTMLYAQHARALSLRPDLEGAIALLDDAIAPLDAADSLSASSERLLGRIRSLRSDFVARLATGESTEDDAP